MTPEAITVRRWAARMLEPAAACILDTETTSLGGSIIEIAVIDAATGHTLLDTLVDPDGVVIDPAAQAVHGITAADLAGAPTWPQVCAQLVAATTGRVVLAYNAEFDHGRVLHDCARTGADPVHLADAARWQCVMARRSEALGLDRRLRLDGGHRALGDVHATRAVLTRLAAGDPDPAATQTALTT